MNQYEIVNTEGRSQNPCLHSYFYLFLKIYFIASRRKANENKTMILQICLLSELEIYGRKINEERDLQ